MTLTVQDIDAIHAAPKRLVGQVSWNRGGGRIARSGAGVTAARSDRDTVAAFKVQLEVNGVIRADVALTGNAVVHVRPQPITLVLTVGQYPVERLDLWPRAPHINPAGKDVPRASRGLVLPPGQHQLHAWPLNRAWPPQGNLPIAERWADMDSAAVAFQSFLARLNIDGTLPPPPFEPRLFP